MARLPSNKIKIKDIAKIAGVSPGTVSNALNNRKGVSEEIKQEILKIAESTGYNKPSAKKTSNNLHFIALNRFGYAESYAFFFYQILDGINSQCKAHDMNLIVSNIPSSALKQCLQDHPNVAGNLILATEMTQDELDDIASAATVPTVLIDNYFPNFQYDFIGSDNEAGFYLATKHLIAHGHKKIGLLSCRNLIHNFYYRIRGFHTALEEAGLSFDPRLEFRVSHSIDEAYTDTLQILQQFDLNALPTAFAALNDTIAVGAIKAFAECGIKIPEDISVIGFDNTALGAINSPALTTIHINFKAVGEAAVSRVVHLMQNAASDRISMLFSPKLIVRDSVQPPRY